MRPTEHKTPTFCQTPECDNFHFTENEAFVLPGVVFVGRYWEVFNQPRKTQPEEVQMEMEMNHQKMLELADFMDTVEPEHFDMQYYGNKFADTRFVCKEDMTICGSTCCIAGYVAVNKGYCVYPGGALRKQDGEIVTSAFEVARKELGLTYVQASHLFYSMYWPEGFDKNNPKEAARLIREMVKKDQNEY